MVTSEQLRLGLHQLKDECDAVERIVGVVGSIVEWFDILLENTLLRCPLRTAASAGADLYRLKPRGSSSFGEHSLEEAKLERSLARRWPATDPENQPFWPGHCLGFVNYQVPLFDKQKSEGWKSIDLVGLSPTRMPQVWELKKRPPADGPFLMVVEAVAYGVALRHAWNRGHFAAAWEEAGLGSPTDRPLGTVELFGVAPTEYWTDARRKWLDTPEKRNALDALLTRCARAGFPVKLVAFTATEAAEPPYFRVENPQVFIPDAT